ncbi:MAG: hypothetical protein IJR93_07865 [Treponema sp.]|nr:hypothetical protein [Treponema sp.]
MPNFFLNSARTNWERLVCTISQRIINGTIRRLTAPARKDAGNQMVKLLAGLKNPGF